MSLILSGTDGLSDVDGSAATPAIRGTDANTGIFFPAADTIAFAEGGAEVARFDSSGNFGLGVTPSYRLDVSKATAGDVARFTNGGASNKSLFVYTDATYAAIATGVGASGTGIAFDAANNKMLFTTASTNQMGLDSSGNLGIGTTSPSAKLHVVGTIYTNAGSADNLLSINGDGAIKSGVQFRANGAGPYTQIYFDNATNNTHYNNLASGAHVFATSNTERARIDSSGNLLVAKTALSTTTVGVELRPGGRVVSTLASSTSGDSTYEVYSTGAGAYRFYVDMSGTIRATSITITAISDERLKENVRDIDTGLNSIMALKPRRFDWKEGKGQDKKNVAGFIAQEFETVFPECVSTSRAGADGIEYKNINQETP